MKKRITKDWPRCPYCRLMLQADGTCIDCPRQIGATAYANRRIANQHISTGNGRNWPEKPMREADK